MAAWVPRWDGGTGKLAAWEPRALVPVAGSPYLGSEGASRVRGRVDVRLAGGPRTEAPKGDLAGARGSWGWLVRGALGLRRGFCWPRRANCFGFPGPAPRFLSHPHDSSPSSPESVFLSPDSRVFQQVAGDCQNGFPILHHSRMSLHQVIPLLDIFIYQLFLFNPSHI